MDESAPIRPLIVDCLQYSKPERARFLEWRAGDVGCVHITLAIWEDARQTLSVITRWHDLLDENSDVIALARSAHDVSHIVASGRTAVIFGFQNLAPLEDDVRLIRVFHELGVRIMQLTYNTQNSIAAGCWEDDDSGLSQHIGRSFIREMNDVGVMIDLSHCSEKTCLDTISLSSRPVAITHANPLDFVGKKVELSRRSKSRAVLQELSASGGVIGLSPYPRMLRNGPDTPLNEFVDMVFWTMDMLGPAHVAFGSDFYTGYTLETVRHWRTGLWGRESPVPLHSGPVVTWPDWFSSPAQFPAILDCMRQRGMSKHELAMVCGGNWMRLFRETFGVGDEGGHTHAPPPDGSVLAKATSTSDWPAP